MASTAPELLSRQRYPWVGVPPTPQPWTKRVSLRLFMAVRQTVMEGISTLMLLARPTSSLLSISQTLARGSRKGMASKQLSGHSFACLSLGCMAETCRTAGNCRRTSRGKVRTVTVLPAGGETASSRHPERSAPRPGQAAGGRSSGPGHAGHHSQGARAGVSPGPARIAGMIADSSGVRLTQNRSGIGVVLELQPVAARIDQEQGAVLQGRTGKASPQG